MGPTSLRWLNSSNAGAVRTFSALTEDNREGAPELPAQLRARGRQHFVKVGGLYRETERDADTRAFAIYVVRTAATPFASCRPSSCSTGA